MCKVCAFTSEFMSWTEFFKKSFLTKLSIVGNTIFKKMLSLECLLWLKVKIQFTMHHISNRIQSLVYFISTILTSMVLASRKMVQDLQASLA